MLHFAVAVLVSGASASQSATNVAMTWSKLWDQASGAVHELAQTGKTNVDISKAAASLGEQERGTPGEIDRLSNEVAKAYQKVIVKGESLLQTSEHSSLKALIQAGKKHIKTLDAMRQGTASGQALLARPQILSRICDLMSDTQCLVEKTVT